MAVGKGWALCLLKMPHCPTACWAITHASDPSGEGEDFGPDQVTDEGNHSGLKSYSGAETQRQELTLAIIMHNSSCGASIHRP